MVPSLILKIDDYLSNDRIPLKEKQKRMKVEVQYSRDTSLSVPKNNPVFKIRAPKQAGKKSRELTAAEFGENLKILLDKKNAAAGKTVTISDFMTTLNSLCDLSN